MNGPITVCACRAVRRSRWALPVLLGAGLLIVMAMPGVAAAQSGVYPGMSRSLTWPPISVSVSLQNGWVVAQGRTTDLIQRVVWQVPVAPAGSFVFQHGWGSVFIQVGTRQFVIDDATGATQELQPGEAVRQFQVLPPPGPSALPYAPPPASPRYAAPSPAAAAPGPAAPPGIEQLSTANQMLMIALGRLDETIRLQKVNQATADDVRKAEAVVNDSRAMVTQAQSIALKQIAPDMLPSPTKPVPGPTTKPAPVLPAMTVIDPQVANMQSCVLELTAEYALAQHEVARLRALPPDQVTDEQIATAQKSAQQSSDQLQAADLQLRDLRMTSGTPKSWQIDPKLRADITSAERKLIEAIRNHEAAERKVMAAQDALDRKEASKDDVAEAQIGLMSALRNISKAQHELDQLNALAAKEMEDKKPTSVPAGATTAPAAGGAVGNSMRTAELP